MKKSIWLALSISAIAAAIGISEEIHMKHEQKEIVIGLQGELPLGPLAPENISTVPLFHLHSNLWDTLITEKRGAAIAESFQVSESGTVYSFKISPDAKFSNGRSINAEDVKFSLERLVSREQNGHINARSAIKHIRTHAQELEIVLNAPTPSFLYLLSSPEFGIVPKESLDQEGNLVDLGITSGPYVVSSIDRENQTIQLRKNSFFRNSSEDSPSKVTLHFQKAVNLPELTERLSSKQFDFIELQNPEADQFFPTVVRSGYSYSVTEPSGSIFLLANSKRVPPGLARLISSNFRRHFRFGTPEGSERPSLQLFPPKTFGSLAKENIPTISEGGAAVTLPSEIRIRTRQNTGALAEEIRRVFGLLKIKVIFLASSDSEQHDYRLVGQGMNTEFPEIELHLQTLSPYATFDADEATKALVQQATHTEDDAKRSQIIQEIGKIFLSSGKVIPLTLRSYVHINNPKTVDASELYNFDGNIPINKMRVLK